jgi:hypothetical protein
MVNRGWWRGDDERGMVEEMMNGGWWRGDDE